MFIEKELDDAIIAVGENLHQWRRDMRATSNAASGLGALPPLLCIVRKHKYKHRETTIPIRDIVAEICFDHGCRGRRDTAVASREKSLNYLLDYVVLF